MTPRCLAAVAVSAVTFLPVVAVAAGIALFDHVRSFARIAVVPDPELAQIVARIDTLNKERQWPSTTPR